MAAEEIGNLYPVTVPGYDDPADIQAALKLLIYGSTDDAVVNATDPLLIPSASIAYHIQQIVDDITALEETGVGSTYSATEPTSPADGYIWVDANSAAGIPAYTYYQPGEPGGLIAEGSIWIEKGSSPLAMYVYDSVDGWLQVGA